MFMLIVIFHPLLQSAYSQIGSFGSLPADGEAVEFINAFNGTVAVRQLRKRVRMNSKEIVYFVCPKHLALVRVNLTSSIDKSRYTILLQPSSDTKEPYEFEEISNSKLLQCGIDAELLFRVVVPNTAPHMGGNFGPLLEMRVRDTSMTILRQDLLNVLAKPKQ